MKRLRFFSAVMACVAIFASCDNTKEVDSISASPSTVTFEAEGGSINVAVTTDKYEVSAKPEWVVCAANGKELVLTADINMVNATREGVIKLTSGTASCEIKVSQKPGSPYPGYKVADSITYEYGGTLIYMFIKPKSEEYGGMAYITLETEDAKVVMEVFTDLYKSEEEVVVDQKTYTLGKDNYGNPMTLYAEPSTFAPGTLSEDEGDIMALGSYVTVKASDTEYAIVDGTLEVKESENGYLFLLDVTDNEGNVYKMVYEGNVEINLEGATYPSDSNHSDPTQDIYEAIMSIGEVDEESGTVTCTLSLLSGDDENCVMSNFELIYPAPVDENNLSGTFTSAEEEDEDGEESEEGITGKVSLGYMMDFGGFSMPMGSYVIYGFGDYDIPDAYVSTILEKNADGTYTINAAMMDNDGKFMHLFLNVKIAITVYKDSDYQDEEQSEEED